MEIDLSTLLPAAGLGGLATWLGQAAASWFKARGERDKAREANETTLEQHRDNLTFELLQEARTHLAMVKSEVEELRKEVKILRGLEKHFYYFEQSLDHLDAILSCPSGTEERNTAERNAKAFLNRMRRLTDARGTIRNEVQIASSQADLAGDRLPDLDEDLPPAPPY